MDNTELLASEPAVYIATIKAAAMLPFLESFLSDSDVDLVERSVRANGHPITFSASALLIEIREVRRIIRRISFPDPDAMDWTLAKLCNLERDGIFLMILGVDNIHCQLEKREKD